MQMSRFVLSTAAVVLAAGALSACGGGSPAPAVGGPPGELVKAADAMDRIGNGRLRFTAAEGDKAPTTLNGYVRWQGRPSFESTEGDSTMRLVQGAMYVRGLGLDRWQRLDHLTSRPDEPPVPIDLATMSMELASSPAAELRRAAGHGTVTAEGREDLGGVPVTHYRSVSPVPARSGKAEQRLVDGPDYTPPADSVCTADYWVNDRYELVKLTLALSAGQERARATAEYSEPGTAPAMPVPAPAEVDDPWATVSPSP
ncbi:hypothetical protein ABZW10_26225 [Kitasatospora sp. NPDC004723]|uniref:hypothetical protein n=1 Tax=Kitasatospora sp. NPDC004723 TaxID=3154288 RepID=UPI0033AC3883